MDYDIMIEAGAVIAASGFGISAVLFFYMKIPAAIGEITGRAARREIEKIKRRTDRETGT